MDSQYTLVQKRGQGAYGCVWKAIENNSKEVVAIKQLKNKPIAKDYENGTNLAEVVALKALQDHPNIIQLKNIIKQDGELFYVFEYMTNNLLQMIKNRTSFPLEVEIQSWMYQILKAMAYMHSKGFIHRDLKPENILVNGGILKLADFGLSKKMCHCLNNMNTHVYNLDYCGKFGCTCGCTTSYMCTRWYRAPEIILRSPSYSTTSDMWSLGVIMAEMFTSLPIFPGTSEKNQLDQISSILGAPNYLTWPQGCMLACNCNFQFKKFSPLVNFAKLIPNASHEAIDLIQSLMVWNPQKRLMASQALRHPFFQVDFKSNQDKFNRTSNYIPKTMHHDPFLHKQAYNMTCAMENNKDQCLDHRTLHSCSFISSYQKACNIIQRNSIVH